MNSITKFGKKLPKFRLVRAAPNDGKDGLWSRSEHLGDVLESFLDGYATDIQQDGLRRVLRRQYVASSAIPELGIEDVDVDPFLPDFHVPDVVLLELVHDLR